MGDVIDERDVAMWGDDTAGHDTACDCKGCLLNEWAAEIKQHEAEIERLRKLDAGRTTRLAKILRLTYHEDMPGHLADAIRGLVR